MHVAQGYLGKPGGGLMEAEERLAPSKEMQVLRSHASRLGPFVVLTGMGVPQRRNKEPTT